MDLAKKLEYAKQHVASITRHDDATIAERSVVVDALSDYIAAEMKDARKRADTKAKADAAAARKVKGAKKVAVEDVGMSEPKRSKKALTTPKRAAKH